MENLNINTIREKIYLIRGKKVMFDKDLAILYGVSTKRLNEAVKRNLRRFPEDFMFQLYKIESDMFLRSQIATSSYKTLENYNENPRSQIATLVNGQNIKYLPYVFTEQGIAMLSSVLKSDKAIEVNIRIIRVFTKLREMMNTYKELREKIEEMEKVNKANFKEIFEVIKILINHKNEEENQIKNPIGFTVS